MDWANVIEEIESVGGEQVHAVRALLMQAMVHRPKAIGWPESRDAENRRADARGFCGQAADRFTPSMRQRLDFSRIYRRALCALPETMAECPWSLEELPAEP